MCIYVSSSSSHTLLFPSHHFHPSRPARLRITRSPNTLVLTIRSSLLLLLILNQAFLMSDPEVTATSCKKIRGNAKGVVTRAANHINHTLTLPPASLDEPSLSRTKDALIRADEKFVSFHQLLLEEFNQLTPEEYEAELTEYHTVFSKTLASVNLLLARLESFRAFNQAETSLALLELTANDGFTPQLLVDLPETKTLCKDYQRISSDPVLTSEPLLVQSRAKMSGRLSTIIKLCQPHLPPTRPPHDSSHPESTATSSSTPHSSNHIKVTLPTFDGQLRHWRAFWECFSSMMEANTHLKPQQKRTFLVKAMETPEAKERAQQVLACTVTYEEAVAKMRYTYEDNIELHRHHVSQIFQAKPYQNTKASLSALLGMLEENTAGIKATNGYTAEQIVTSHLFSLLPPIMQSKWKERVGKSSHPPTQIQFESFLRDMIHASTDSIYLPNTTEVPPSEGLTPPSKSSVPSTVTNSTTSRPNPPPVKRTTTCRMCSEDHSIFSCAKMIELSVPARLQWALDSRVCLNCFRPNHPTEKCGSGNRCRVCHKLHHTLIHQNMDGPTEQTACAVTQLPQITLFAHSKCTVPMTASVRARSNGLTQMGRAHLDTGANVTLVTRDFAQRLRAKKIPNSSSSVTGVCSSTRTLHQIRLTLLGSPKMGCGRQSISIIANVVEQLPPPTSPVNMDAVRQLPFVTGLPLADPNYAPGVKVDILLEMAAVTACSLHQVKHEPSANLEARKTIFGWTIGGSYHPPQAPYIPSVCFVNAEPPSPPPSHQAQEDIASLLRKFWAAHPETDSPSASPSELDPATSHFLSTFTRDFTGRYWVLLPRMLRPPLLGESYTLAFHRFVANEKALRRKGTLLPYQAAVQEYITLGHAELVPKADLSKPNHLHYYLPMHGVVKASSTSTKLRPVCDASAKTSTGISLNDQLLIGPSLYPRVWSLVNRFRTHTVALTADISKMYRQVGLQLAERDFHRFLHRDSQGVIRPHRMTRLTFGVSSSPCIATQVLHQAATDHQVEFPRAAHALRTSFYVDDLLTGASSVEEAAQLRQALNDLLDRAGMPLCKWRSNSEVLMESIPPHLRESSSLAIPSPSHPSLKALGIHWDAQADVFFLSVPDVAHITTATKRTLASVVARIFDPLGWFGPATIPAKLLLQRSWTMQLDWDTPLPTSEQHQWFQWLAEIPSIHSHPIPRQFCTSPQAPLESQLHGFADASKKAYGGVVYSRHLHSDTKVTVSLVSSRSKLAPLDGQTIPRLELAGALLLAHLLHSVATDLSIPPSCVFAWTDSSIVLGWLNQNPIHLETYVANRVRQIVELIPAHHWRYVSTSTNPADILSRGESPAALCSNQLWWSGPTWLALQPASWPRRRDINLARELPAAGPPIALAVSSPPTEFTLHSSNFSRLVRIFAWINRFVRSTRRQQTAPPPPYLSLIELREAQQTLFKHTQFIHYSFEIERLAANRPLPKGNRLKSLAPFLDKFGMLRVGGRLQQSNLSTISQHPLILHQQSHTIRLMVQRDHVHMRHAGSSTMMAVLACTYHIQRLKPYLKAMTHQCPICLRRAARTSQVLMGQLPAARVQPSAPFSHVGVDFAGPFLIRRGHTRRPVLEKTYLCLFVCFATKAVHIEVASDMTSLTFLACLSRFVGRRGAPSHIYSDNGSNFLGSEPYVIQSKSSLPAVISSAKITSWAAHANVHWSFSPPKGPHHGGLWEAGIKSMKTLLGSSITNGLLTFEELITLSVEVEAILNSRPLAPLDSISDDTVDVLTPGHFLVGRPLVALPYHHDLDQKVSLLRRWNLVERLTHNLWQRWKTEYLQALQQRPKWQSDPPSLTVGDVVMVKDTLTFQRDWPLAIITALCPGPDNRTRVVELRSGTTILKRPVANLVKLLDGSPAVRFPGEDVPVGLPPSTSPSSPPA